MHEQLDPKDGIKATVSRDVATAEHVGIKGRYIFELVRNGEVIDRRVASNVVTTEGKNYLFDVGVDAETSFTQSTNWFVALASNASSPSPAAGDTYATWHGTACTEFDDYTGDRKAYVGVVSGGAITNTASKASFAIVTPAGDDTGDVYGAALLSSDTASSTKLHNTSGAGRYLLSWAALPGGVLNVQDGDTLNVEIQISM